MTGFSRLKKLDISGVPDTRGQGGHTALLDERIADRVAQRRSLPSDPVGRVALARGTKVRDKMFIEGPLDTLNRFRAFCNRENLPMHAALERLLDLTEVG